MVLPGARVPLLAGRLQPTKGEVSPDRKLIVGRYDQHFDELLPVEKNLSAGGAVQVECSFNPCAYKMNTCYRTAVVDLLPSKKSSYHSVRSSLLTLS
jgi:hypothetical protein